MKEEGRGIEQGGGGFRRRWKGKMGLEEGREEDKRMKEGKNEE